MDEKSALMLLPRCSVHHIDMEYHVPRTPEQSFVGAMYVCPQCSNSTLLPSKQLLIFLERMKSHEAHPEVRRKSVCC